MGWKIVERKIGRAGGPKQRQARRAQWDEKHGDGNWVTGYVWQGRFYPYEQAVEELDNRSYEIHFARRPEDLDELCQRAKRIFNPHALHTGGVDLQVPAILVCLRKLGRRLEGSDNIPIGSYG